MSRFLAVFSGFWLFLGCALGGCGEQLKACEAATQCPVNLACIDGFCRRAPFTDSSIGTGDIATPVDALKRECPSTPGGPAARAEASGAVVAGVIVAMGGDSGLLGRCGADVQVAQDHWRHDRCKGWALVTGSGLPPVRQGGATATDQGAGVVYLYGGRQRTTAGSWVPYRDLWAFDRTAADGTWKLLAKTGTQAVSHAGLAVDASRNRLWLLGGDRSLEPGKVLASGVVMLFDLKTRQWALSTAKGAPPARSRHALAMADGDTHLYVFGGLLSSGKLDNQLWRLDVGKNKWEVVAAAGERPTARAGAQLVKVPGQKRMLLFGGADSTAIGFRNDVWRLDTDKLRWDRIHHGDLGVDGAYGGKVDLGDGLNCNSGKPAGGLPAAMLQIDYGAPQRRAFAITGWDVERAALVIFGGRGECGALADAWRLDAASTTWTPIDGTSNGWSCPRRKPAIPGQKPNCSLLCEP